MSTGEVILATISILVGLGTLFFLVCFYRSAPASQKKRGAKKKSSYPYSVLPGFFGANDRDVCHIDEHGVLQISLFFDPELSCVPEAYATFQLVPSSTAKNIPADWPVRSRLRKVQIGGLTESDYGPDERAIFSVNLSGFNRVAHYGCWEVRARFYRGPNDLLVEVERYFEIPLFTKFN